MSCPMNKKIVYLPLDERPCNYEFAGRIADMARGQIRFVRPDYALLGDKKTPAPFDGLRKFLLCEIKDADGLVISLDMLLYGGIVPSRLHTLSADEIAKRLAVLDDIKAVNPAIKIYAFALIMRCPSYSSADEEPDYYEVCGKQIFIVGQIKHKCELGLITSESAQNQIAELSRGIDGFDGFLRDYEARREINRNALIDIIKRSGSTIDYLVIPQDDSAPYGYTTRDRQYILSRCGDVIPMYPGADEAGMTLLCRMSVDFLGVTPKIKCVYATQKSKSLVPLYEDRELYKTVASHISAAGCKLDDEGEITLFLNYPAFGQNESGEHTQGYAERDMDGFINKIAAAVNGGGIAAVADGAFCNGGDIDFIKQLSARISLFGLAAYAGWNTSANTLGTAICQAVFVRLFGRSYFSDKFLAERLYEDIGYLAHTRSLIIKNELPALGLNYFNAGGRTGEVSQKVKAELNRYMAQILPEVASRFTVDECFMPWKRMFEVGLTVKSESAKFKTVGVWHRPNDDGTEVDLDGLVGTLRAFSRAGINLVFLETFYHGVAAYRSDIAEYNPALAAHSYGGYKDYLTAFVAEAKKLGIAVHAWVEDFYIGVKDSPLITAHPDWLMKTEHGSVKQSEGGGYYFLDPANTEACDYLIALYKEILSLHTDIAGLNLDYIRYPLSDESDDTGYTEAAISGFTARFGTAPQSDYAAWVKYRAELVTRFVRRVRDEVKGNNKSVLLSTAVFPQKQLSYETKKQDFASWIEAGLLDFVTPMAYCDDPYRLNEAISDTLTYTLSTPTLVGLSPTYHGLPVQDVLYQAVICNEQKASGIVFFGSKSILQNERYIHAVSQLNQGVNDDNS